MKKSIVAIAAVVVVFLYAHSQVQPEQRKNTGNLKTTVIEVKTVKCDTCARAIAQALRRIEGVRSVQVDLTKKIVTVVHHPVRVRVANLERAISYAGYDANNVKRNAKAYERLPECCK